MCGIVGCVGKNKSLPFLLSGLKNLEYRGYDSCGVALVDEMGLHLYKTKGTADKLGLKLTQVEIQAQTGIGHTRWATHGKPSRRNAHPHTDCRKEVAVVHNGIIENFLGLKKELTKKGHQFSSETDTEILAHLIEEELKNVNNLKTAVASALKKVEGAYGVAVVAKQFPGQIVAARLSSPLIIGFGKNANYLASDQPAIVNWTDNLIILDDYQIAVITKDSVSINDINGAPVTYKTIKITKLAEKQTKGKFKHFTRKEIFEQPEVIKKGLTGRFKARSGEVKLGGIEDHLKKQAKYPYLTLVANGTSYYASLIGKIYFQSLAKKTTLVENAADIKDTNFNWKPKQPVIFVSQSGETADVLTALKEARKENADLYGLVNVVSSSIARETNKGVYLRAGYEIGVASTKAFTAQILALLLWSMRLAKERDIKIDPILKKEVITLPEIVLKTLKDEEKIKKLAKSLKNEKRLTIIGRGPGFPIALEGALKIKELAYIPAEGIQSGEFKHGPLALINEKSKIIAVLPDNEDFERGLSNIFEITSRGANVILLTNKKEFKNEDKNIKTFLLPECHYLLSPFPFVIYFQLLAYWLAFYLGRKIDKPRNLAKSVTVE